MAQLDVDAGRMSISGARERRREKRQCEARGETNGAIIRTRIKDQVVLSSFLSRVQCRAPCVLLGGAKDVYFGLHKTKKGRQ